jgi:hypothetical protein
MAEGSQAELLRKPEAKPWKNKCGAHQTNVGIVDQTDQPLILFINSFAKPTRDLCNRVNKECNVSSGDNHIFVS